MNLQDPSILRKSQLRHHKHLISAWYNPVHKSKQYHHHTFNFEKLSVQNLCFFKLLAMWYLLYWTRILVFKQWTIKSLIFCEKCASHLFSLVFLLLFKGGRQIPPPSLIVLNEWVCSMASCSLKGNPFQLLSCDWGQIT